MKLIFFCHIRKDVSIIQFDFFLHKRNELFPFAGQAQIECASVRTRFHGCQITGLPQTFHGAADRTFLVPQLVCKFLKADVFRVREFG